MSALSFLSKKSWHTGLQTNQKAVWEAEKAALDERRKLDELRKERERERELQELERLHEQSGGRKARRQERVDWMYSAPASGSQIDKNELEEYLLGKKRVDKLLKEQDAVQQANLRNGGAPTDSGNASSAAGPSSAVNSDREVASKIREDPMFAIRQQEQAAYQALLKDPARLRAMRKAAGLDYGKQESKEERRRRKEEKRRARDEERHSDRRRRDDVDDAEYERERRHRSRRDRDEVDDDRRRHRRREEEEDRYHRSNRDRDYDRRKDYESSHCRDARDDRRADRDARPDERYVDEERNSRHRDLRHPDRRHDAEHRRRRSSQSPDRHDEHQRKQERPSRHLRSPPPSTSRPRPAEYPTNKDDDGEDARRQARLAAMQQNATELSSSRTAYLADVQAQEAQDLAREEALREKVRQSRRAKDGGGSSGGPGFGSSDTQGAFLVEQQKNLFGAGGQGSGMDLAERLRRGRDTLQRFQGD